MTDSSSGVSRSHGWGCEGMWKLGVGSFDVLEWPRHKVEDLAWKAPLKYCLVILYVLNSCSPAGIESAELLKVKVRHSASAESCEHWPMLLQLAGRQSFRRQVCSLHPQVRAPQEAPSRETWSIERFKANSPSFPRIRHHHTNPSHHPPGILHPTTTDNNSRWRKLLPSDSELLDDPTTLQRLRALRTPPQVQLPVVMTHYYSSYDFGTPG